MDLNISEQYNKKKKLVSKLITGAFIGLAVCAIFLLWSDASRVKEIVASIPISYFILTIMFTLFSYGLRFVKWHYYLAVLHINQGISIRHSLQIFFIGLSMSITPGKVGELLKSFLIQKVNGTEISRSAPAVFVDRLTDMLAMIVLIGMGVTIFSFNYLPVFAVLLIVIIFILFVQSRVIFIKLLDLLTSIRFLKKYKRHILTIYEGTYELLRIKPLLLSTIVSIAAWFLECVSLYILIRSLNLDVSLLGSILVFALGTVAGALSMLPGGLGIAEGSITGLLMLFDIDKSTAVSVTLLIRLVTLWLGVIIGLAIFFRVRKRYSL